MIETHEPKDGDFIAYIEQLQKQQAARLHGAAAELENPSVPESQPAAQKRTRSASRPRQAIPGLAGAVVPLFLGLAVGLHWFIGGGGLPSLLVAVALVAYGAKQLHRLRQQQSYEHSQAAARIAQMLGQIRK